MAGPTSSNHRDPLGLSRRWVRATALDPMLVPRPPLRFAARSSWPIMVYLADRIAHHRLMTAPGVGMLRGWGAVLYGRPAAVKDSLETT